MKKALIAQVSILVLLAIVFLASNAAAFETYSAGCVDCHGSFPSGTYSSLAAAKAANPVWPGTLHNVHRNSSTQSPPGMLNGNCNACHYQVTGPPVYTYQSSAAAPFNLSCSGCHVGPGLRAHHVNSHAADSTSSYYCYSCHTNDPTPNPENVLPPVYTATFGTTSGTTRVNDPCNPSAAGFDGRLADITTIGLDHDGNLLYGQNDPACKPSAPVISVAPTTLTFGNQNVGTTSAAKTVTISNTGTAVLTVSAIANSNTTDFSISTPTPPFTIAAGGSQTFTVAFKPGTTGGKSATISITSNGGNASVSATGTGTTAPAPVLGVSPTTLTFGSQTVGTTSVGQTVTLSNTGNAPLNVSTISSSSAEFKFSPSTVAPIAAGSSATLSITFAPTTPGPKSGTISITSDGGSGSVSATGTGVAATVTVPNVVGMTQAAATTAITNAGLKVGTVTTQSSATVPAGSVISQNPAANASVASGSAVNLVVSSGPAPAGDVGLMDVIGPIQTSAWMGKASTVNVIAEAIPTAQRVAATVTLTSAVADGVKVTISPPSITKTVGTGTIGSESEFTKGGLRVTAETETEEGGPTRFAFSARISCTKRGTWPVTWTATISSAQNSDPSNDVVTGTTQVICNNGRTGGFDR